MTSTKFKIGAIVRKKLPGGKPIGPYMQIMHVEHNRVYVDVIGLDTPNVMLLKRNTHVCTTKSLIVSEEILERLKREFVNNVQHVATTTWMNVLDKEPELIKLYTQPKGYTATFVLENIKYVHFFGEKYVRVYVGKRIL